MSIDLCSKSWTWFPNFIETRLQNNLVHNFNRIVFPCYQTCQNVPSNRGFVFSTPINCFRFNRQWTIDNRQQTVGNRQQTIDNRQQTLDNRQQTVDNRQQTVDNRQRTIDNRQWTMDNRQQAIDNSQVSLQVETFNLNVSK